MSKLTTEDAVWFSLRQSEVSAYAVDWGRIGATQGFQSPEAGQAWDKMEAVRLRVAVRLAELMS